MIEILKISKTGPTMSGDGFVGRDEPVIDVPTTIKLWMAVKSDQAYFNVRREVVINGKVIKELGAVWQILPKDSAKSEIPYWFDMPKALLPNVQNEVYVNLYCNGAKTPSASKRVTLIRK